MPDRLALGRRSGDPSLRYDGQRAEKVPPALDEQAEVVTVEVVEPALVYERPGYVREHPEIAGSFEWGDHSRARLSA